MTFHNKYQVRTEKNRRSTKDFIWPDTVPEFRSRLVSYLRLIAFSGHISWQQKQAMHFAGSTRGIVSIRDKADIGQCS
ncbi:MAG TPA: hypothetical protein VF903_02590, partial [Nitrospirota bacterium]